MGIEVIEEKIGVPSRTALEKLRKYIKTLNASPSLSRYMETGMDIIDQSAYYLSLSEEIKSLSAKIFSEMHRRGLIRGISVFIGSLAAVYAACRRKGIAITLNDISLVMDTPKKGIAKQFRKLLVKTGINLPLPNYEGFIKRYSQELKISGMSIRLAIELLKIAQEKRIIIGKDPAVIAASLIYLASLYTKASITQAVLSEQALITEVSLRNNYKKILAYIKPEIIEQLYNDIWESHEEGKDAFADDSFYDSYHSGIPQTKIQDENYISSQFTTIENEDEDQALKEIKSNKHKSLQTSKLKKLTLDKFLTLKKNNSGK